MTLIDKLLDEGNCVRVTERGEEAREWVGKLTKNRRQPHFHQSREATNRNLIQGWGAPVSEPNICETVSFTFPGKSRACAVKVNRLILGELESRSGSRLYTESRSWAVKASRRFQQSAEVVVPSHRTPAVTGRTEP